MKEKINQELVKLEKELSSLDNAVSQIRKAEKISTEVIDAVKKLHTKYTESIEKINSNTETHLNESVKKTEEKILETIDFQKQQAENIFQKQKDQIEESRKIITELKNEITHTGEKTNTEIQIIIDNNKTEIKTLTEIHYKQINEVNSLLKNYLDLADSANKLSESIEQVNFPQRLDKITVNIGDINKEIRNILANIKILSEDDSIEILQKRVRKNNRKINFTILMVILIFLILIFLGYEIIFLKYFPKSGIF